MNKRLIEDADEIDRDVPIADLDDDDGDDGTRAVIAKALRDQLGSMEEDEDAFGGSLEPTKGKELVAQEEGSELLEKASRNATRKSGEPTEKDGEEEPATGKDELEEEKPDAGKAPVATSIDLTGLDEPRAAAVRAQLAVVEHVMALFKGQEAELAARGVTPATVVQRLMDLNTYANEKPAEYLAWVAEQTNGAKPEEVLAEAAKLLGFKVVPENEDPFEDEATKALREENRRLKGPRVLGPNDPARQVAQDLNSFVGEKDETGAPKRPHFEKLRPQITAAAAALRAKEGRGITTADLGRIYDQVAGELGIATPAARTAPPVADTTGKNAANERALRASKSIDGSGQGADRRPALGENASVRDTIRHFAGIGSSD